MSNQVRFKFCGRNNEHNNQVDIELKDGSIILHCWTDGYRYGNGYGARFCAGGNNYDFPSDREPTYENIIQFILNDTWIGNKIEDIVDKEVYINWIQEQGYNIKDTVYYKGVH